MTTTTKVDFTTKELIASLALLRDKYQESNDVVRSELTDSWLQLVLTLPVPVIITDAFVENLIAQYEAEHKTRAAGALIMAGVILANALLKYYAAAK